MYDPFTARWTAVDPLARRSERISPWCFCAANPINYYDPLGLSTHVIQNRDGTYTVIGGNIDDKDKRIYLCTYDENGNKVIGSAIGETATLYSFYDTDTKSWNVNAVIDPSDNNGIEFLKVIEKGVSPISYVLHSGQEYQLHDFKHSNNDPSHVGKENARSDTNRGMPIGKTRSGKIVFASARDIGNIGAGIVADEAFLSWTVARLGFDGYQTIQSIKGGGKVKWYSEGETTQHAQWYGWRHPGRIRRSIKRYEKKK